MPNEALYQALYACEARIAQGKDEEARSALAALWQQAAADPKLRFQIIATRFALGETSSTAADLEALFKGQRKSRTMGVILDTLTRPERNEKDLAFVGKLLQGEVAILRSKQADAGAAFRDACMLDTSHPFLWERSAIAFFTAQEWPAALSASEEALKSTADKVTFHHIRGTALRAMALWKQALPEIDAALALAPARPEFLIEKGVAEYNLNALDAALASNRQALALAPQSVEAKWNLAFVLLKLGQYEEGLAAYDIRTANRTLISVAPRALPGEPWQGQSLTGKKLLIESEQGLGDTIQFARFIPALLRQNPEKIYIEVQPPAKTLLEHSFAADRDRIEIFARGPNWPAVEGLPDADYHCLLMSLARHAGATPEHLKTDASPYLSVPVDTVAGWRAFIASLAPVPTLKVGLVWAGSQLHPSDRERSITSDLFRPLLDMPGVSFFSLQVFRKAAKTARVVPEGVVDLAPFITTSLDMAGMIMALDLVISVDTAPLHLAGALGRPAFGLLAAVSDWRWMLDRADTPWYPTLTLFRQKTPGDWSPVIAEVKAALADVKAMPTGASVSDDLPPAYSVIQNLFNGGAHEAVVAMSDRRLASHSDDAASWEMRALSLSNLGRADDALTAFSQAAALAPQSVDYQFNFGTALMHQKRFDAAELAFKAVLAMNAAHSGALCNLGAVLRSLGRFEDAAVYLHRAIAAAPDLRQAHFNLGLVQRDLEQFSEALASFDAVLAFYPEDAAAHSNRAVVLQRLSRWEEGLEAAKRAQALDPANPNFMVDVGIALDGLDRCEDAIAAYRRAMAVEPGHRNARWNIAFPLLKLGRWEEGFAAYEARIGREDFKGLGTRPLPGRRWQGEPLANKKLFIESEQGLGDTIHFSRFLPLLLQQNPKEIIFEVQPPLSDLLRVTFAGFGPRLRILPRAADWPAVEGLPDADYHCLLLSLGTLLRVTPQSLAPRANYLSPASDLVNRFAVVMDQLVTPEAMRVGVVFAGNPQHPMDFIRSPGLDPLRSLFDLENVAWFSLQLDSAGRPSGIPLPPGFIDLSPSIKSSHDMAAMMMSLDLIIAPDTAPLHLAGALGRPAFALLSYACDWRWLKDREDSVWYPALKLFRQSALGDWSSVVTPLRAAIAARRLEPRRRASAILSYDALAVLYGKGEYAKTEAGCRTRLAAYDSEARTWELQGMAISKQGGRADWRDCFERALTLAPNQAELHLNYGVALANADLHDEAIVRYRKALEIDPGLGGIYHNIAISLRKKVRYTEALAASLRAVHSTPDNADFWDGVGRGYQGLGQSERALEAYGKAATIAPDHDGVKLNMSFPLLRLGDWRRGFALYEARQRCGDILKRGTRQLAGALWQGEPLEGKTIFIESEQGLGDTIQFARFIKDLILRQPAKIIFEVQAPLLSLMRQNFAPARHIVEVIARGPNWPSTEGLPATDYYCLLLSLPFQFRTALETLPPQMPYLQAPNGLVAGWRIFIASFARPGTLKVGIVGDGNPQHPMEPLRSIGFEKLAPLFGAEYVTYFSLQLDRPPSAETLTSFPFPVIDLGAHIKTVADTAAIMMSLDLIISIDSAPLHLAGALGRPAFGLLAYANDWRWLAGRTDTPWYPSVTLFRQATHGSGWDDVLTKLKAAVAAVRPNAPAFAPGWSAPPSLDLAKRLAKAGLLEQAEAISRERVKLMPGDAFAWQTLGIMMADRGQVNAALYYFEQAASVAPRSAEHLFNLGTIYMRLNRSREALTAFGSALEHDPRHVGALCNSGSVLRDLNQRQEALVCFQRALTVDPAQIIALLHVGLISAEFGRYDEARDALQTCLRHQPNYEPAQDLLRQIDRAMMAKGG